MAEKVKRKALLLVFKMKRGFGKWFSTQNLDYPKHPLKILTHNIREHETRARSCRKEPETIAWIEKYGKEGGVFYDIGANIGAYSLVAAVNNFSVLAFEPSYENFCTLERNITLNGLDNTISSYMIAFSSKTEHGSFVFDDISSGSARCTYVSGNISLKQDQIKKSILSFTLDEFIRSFSLPIPTLLKIDVDGGEYAIIEGAKNILRNEALKSLLVEVDMGKGNSSDLVKTITDAGFILESKHERRGNAYNMIFKKNDIH